ncbi:MAG: hypothetical protein HFJ89_09730 [Oscillospiraceae bacterium]|jgi:hypothetical protein|nr:hypothetical protein [Oscillospiraceae bacterium]
MDKNFSVLKFLSQVFMIYGITTGLLNIFCILFGRSAYDFSTIFSLGNTGVGIATSFQFLLAVFLIVGLKFIFMTDILIKKIPLAARIIIMFTGAFATILVFIFAFGWVPANMPIAWIMFIICFVLSCAVSTVISVLAEKQENRRLEEALKRYKEEQ